MSSWPVLAVGLRLQGEPVLVVGAGNVATEKIAKLRLCGANLTVVAPEACDAVQQLALDGQLRWIQRVFKEEDVLGRLLVVSATGREGVDLQVYAACNSRNILCNSADVPEACNVWLMAQIQEGPLTLAVGTSGTAPGLARRLIREARAGLPADVAERIVQYANLRRWTIEDLAAGPQHLAARMAMLRELATQPWSWLSLAAETQREELARRWNSRDQPR